MTPTRKERIERAALALWIDGIGYDEAIPKATKFIDAIDALPDEPADDVAEAKRILGVRPDAPLVGSLLNFVHQRTRNALDGPLNRKSDHIPDAGQKVELPGKWKVQVGDGDKDSIYFGGMESDTGAFADFAAFALDDVEADKIIAAANKLRELTFAAAFRAGVEAAAAIAQRKAVRGTSADHVEIDPELAGYANAIRAIPTPKID